MGTGAVVRGPLHLAARVDHRGQSLVAERSTHRGDQLDGEVVVPIGEQILCEIGQRPHGGRTAAAVRRARARDDEAVVGERVEMLAYAGLGHVERLGEIRDLGVGALQPLDDPPLGRAEVLGFQIRAGEIGLGNIDPGNIGSP